MVDKGTKVLMLNTRSVENRIYANVCSHLQYFSAKPFQNVIGVPLGTTVTLSSGIEIVFVDATNGPVTIQLPDPADVILSAPAPTICSQLSYSTRTRPIHIEFIGDCNNSITLTTIGNKIRTADVGGAVTTTSTYTTTDNGAITLYSNGNIWSL